jgi:hypothetical protein
MRDTKLNDVEAALQRCRDIQTKLDAVQIKRADLQSKFMIEMGSVEAEHKALYNELCRAKKALVDSAITAESEQLAGIEAPKQLNQSQEASNAQA